MNIDLIIGILNIVLISTTPLVFAGIGELVTEKSGVLNLGLEGLMLVGAVTGFITLVLTGNYFYSLFFSIISGVILSGIFAFLVLNLITNQIATGLALTIFGIGLSAMLGKKFSGTPIEGLNPYYFITISFLLVFLVCYFLSKTKSGLIVRAVGENHNSAYALGYNVIKTRYMTIIFGGIMRCDVLAQGVVDAAKEINLSVPLVVRLAGTNFKEGKEILDKSNLKILSASDLNDAAKKIVEAIK